MKVEIDVSYINRLASDIEALMLFLEPQAIEKQTYPGAERIISRLKEIVNRREMSKKYFEAKSFVQSVEEDYPEWKNK